MSAQAAAKIDTLPSYDEVPYESFAYAQTHPSHVSTVATLFGLTPPDFRTARILELGCGVGGNLLPLAHLYPKAHFLGIDLSREQIAQANQHKKNLNLSNLEFLQQDLLKFSPQNKNEKFDYIICHGVLSWVPENVQKKIFEICKEWLSPNGLAVISYNALPGWNAVRSLREMMLYHIRRFTSPAEKLQQAGSLLAFLSENVGQDKASYRAVIDEELKNLTQMGNNSYLYHDHLEGNNTQFYLHQFVDMAQAEGLGYVGDAYIGGMFAGNMSPKVADALKVINDAVSQEQYLDFITNRRFRTSIICKEASKLNRSLRPEQIMDYFLTMNSQMEIIGSDPSKDIVFKSGAASFTTHEPISGALFLELQAAGPVPLAATELFSRVQKRLGLNDAQAVQNILVTTGMSFVLKGFLNIHSDSPACVREVSKKPVAFALARYEAGRNHKMITSVSCQMLRSNEAANILLKNMDGSRTVADLAGILVESVQKGHLKLESETKTFSSESEIRQEVTSITEETLKRFARDGLLVG